MNRPIKFRAWVNKHIDPFMTYEVDSIDFEAGDVYVNKGLAFAIGKEADLMQFTGLTDKNGKEIYEGDIVGVVPYYSNPTGGSFLVEWDKDCAQWAYQEQGMDEMEPLTNLDMETVLVIGNIYENPNLINEDAPGTENPITE